MTKSTFADQSTTPGSNTSLDGNDVSENCSMAGMNNAMRSLAAMGKSAGTFIATTGTDTYLATFAPIPDALATDFLYGFNFTSANTSTTPNLSPSGLGPKTIVDMSGNALLAGALNGRHILIYDGTNFRVLNPAKTTIATANVNIGATTVKATRALADSLVINDVAGGNVGKIIAFPAALSGMPIQIVNTETGAVLTGTTIIPFDDTIPQNTEGDQYMSLAITPTNASSILLIDVCFIGAINGSAQLQVALFQDSTAGALAIANATIGTSASMATVPFRHKMTAGTTSATTFKVRAGPDASAIVTFNGSGGGRKWGGVSASSITITEILP